MIDPDLLLARFPFLVLFIGALMLIGLRAQVRIMIDAWKNEPNAPETPDEPTH